jgi:hypothetical protein
MWVSKTGLVNHHVATPITLILSSHARCKERTGTLSWLTDRPIGGHTESVGSNLSSIWLEALPLWTLQEVLNMTVQTFHDLLHATPFRPFRLVMSSGQTYEVRHPEMAMLTRSDILVGVGDVRDGVPARFKICSLRHVTAIEPIEQTASERGATSA